MMAPAIIAPTPKTTNGVTSECSNPLAAKEENILDAVFGLPMPPPPIALMTIANANAPRPKHQLRRERHRSSRLISFSFCSGDGIFVNASLVGWAHFVPTRLGWT